MKYVIECWVGGDEGDIYTFEGRLEEAQYLAQILKNRDGWYNTVVTELDTWWSLNLTTVEKEIPF
jgi:hypothetical protein